MASEFSPDSIQFQKQAATATPIFSPGPIYEQIQKWLIATHDEKWQAFLKTKSEAELLRSLAVKLFFSDGISDLTSLQARLREVSTLVTEQTLSAFTAPLTLLFNHWQKQVDALLLMNKQAYEKVSEEKNHWEPGFPLDSLPWTTELWQACLKIDLYLEDQATRLLKTEPRQPTFITYRPKTDKTTSEQRLIKSKNNKYLLDEHLPASLFQLEAPQWLRRALRALQMALKTNFEQPVYLQKTVKYLYAALEQESDYVPAILLLGWIHACCNNPEGSLACLEYLRTLDSTRHTLALIQFLQDPQLR